MGTWAGKRMQSFLPSLYGLVWPSEGSELPPLVGRLGPSRMVISCQTLGCANSSEEGCRNRGGLNGS